MTVIYSLYNFTTLLLVHVIVILVSFCVNEYE
jgi:hypothetical protein